MKIEKLNLEDTMVEDLEVQGCMGCTEVIWSGATNFITRGCAKVTVYNTGWEFGSLF